MDLDESWREPVNVDLHGEPNFSHSLSLSRIDKRPARRSGADGGGIRTGGGSFRNQRSKIIISVISMQPLVQAATRASKSI